MIWFVYFKLFFIGIVNMAENLTEEQSKLIMKQYETNGITERIWMV